MNIEEAKSEIIKKIKKACKEDKINFGSFRKIAESYFDKVDYGATLDERSEFFTKKRKCISAVDNLNSIIFRIFFSAGCYSTISKEAFFFNEDKPSIATRYRVISLDVKKLPDEYFFDESCEDLNKALKKRSLGFTDITGLSLVSKELQDPCELKTFLDHWKNFLYNYFPD